MVSTLPNDRFGDQLPSSVTFDPKVSTISDVSDIRHIGLYPIVQSLIIFANIGILQEPILDLLAFQFGVLFYASANSISDPVARLALKRQLIQNSFAFNRQLGTAQILQTVLSQIYTNITVQEWFQYGGTHDHFRFVTDNTISSGLQTQILATSLIVKRASQACEGFVVFTVSPTKQIFVTIACFVESFIGVARIVPTLQLLTSIGAVATVWPIPKVNRASANTLIARTVSIVATAKIYNPSQLSVDTILAIAAMTAHEVVLRIAKVTVRAGHG